MATYSNRIRELRNARKLNQEQLADMLGITKQAVSQYETGSRKPSTQILEALSDIFNVSTDYILGKEDVTVRLVGSDGIRLLDDPDSRYHTNDETAEIAQWIYDDKDLRLLFDAARGSNPDSLKLAAEMLRRMKDTNKDG